MHPDFFRYRRALSYMLLVIYAAMIGELLS